MKNKIASLIFYAVTRLSKYNITQKNGFVNTKFRIFYGKLKILSAAAPKGTGIRRTGVLPTIRARRNLLPLWLLTWKRWSLNNCGGRFRPKRAE